MTNEEFATASASFTWTFAKTMPQCPHEYIVRGKTADDETYFAMFHAIEERGIWGAWEDYSYQYLHPGDGFYYWKMDEKAENSIILNRSKENTDGDHPGFYQKKGEAI